jgi:hypothetical protein
MSQQTAHIMQRLHGENIYADFEPPFDKDLQGWNSEHQAFHDIIEEIRPTIVVDVGVWKGASTIYLAELLKTHGIAGTVIAVDTFLGSYEHSNSKSDLFNLIPRRNGMPRLYEQFLSNVVRAGVSDRVVPLPQTSTNASLLLHDMGVIAGLVHIDASHEYADVLQDARAYWELLKPGGYLVGDDYHHYWPVVIKAADEFALEKGVQLSAISPKWVVRKPI